MPPFLLPICKWCMASNTGITREMRSLDASGNHTLLKEFRVVQNSESMKREIGEREREKQTNKQTKKKQEDELRENVRK